MAGIGRWVGRWAAIATVVLLAGCSAQFRNHGYVPDEAALANIAVGRDTRDSVARLIGAPTASALVGDDAWYYVESRFKTVAWMAPREVDRVVVAISFDRAGRVANIEKFGLEDGNIVTLSRRVTRTTSDRIPFLRKVFGNLAQGGLFK